MAPSYFTDDMWSEANDRYALGGGQNKYDHDLQYRDGSDAD